MTKDIKPLFKWANKIGDANINNRILAKVMPHLIMAKITLTDAMIQSEKSIEVPQELYDLIKKSTESLLGSEYLEEK